MNLWNSSSIWIYVALFFFAAVSCTQQDEPNGSETFPEGEYPLEINASALPTTVSSMSVSTRATVDGNWQGVKTVAVETGGLAKEYTVTAGNRVARLSSNDPHYWTNRDPIIVSAWWPCRDEDGNFLTTMPAVVVKPDQSEQDAFQSSDFIVTEAQKVLFDYPTLVFSHRTARVTINLKAGTGMQSVAGAKVALINLSIENNNPDTIVAYPAGDCIYEALTAPQIVPKGTPFIQVELDKDTFVFTPKKDVVLEANQQKTYNVSVTTEVSEKSTTTKKFLPLF